MYLFCGELDGESSVLRVVGDLGDGQRHARLPAAAADISLPLLLLGPNSIGKIVASHFGVKNSNLTCAHNQKPPRAEIYLLNWLPGDASPGPCAR